MLNQFIDWLKELFNLNRYKSRSEEVIESISSSVEFKGTNLWILIFAIFIASIGLNVNSSAVIIGAMLISPLMGPILGVGLGVGIYDFRLIKKSAKNLAVAAVISIITAALYFLVTPLKFAQSELLARTTPTVWDVMIGFLGGLAGIIAISSKEKGNVIPGVAIATALIPPLCTAGYGLATGNPYYFFGAFYLFLINSVFICYATILIVRYLKFPQKTFVDRATGVRVRRSVTLVVIVTIIPSIIIASRLVLKTLYVNNVEFFLQEELYLPGTYIGHKEVDYQKRKVEVYLVGKEIDSTEMEHIKLKLGKYNLEGTLLVVKQGEEKAEHIFENREDQTLLEDVIRRNSSELDRRQHLIDSLSQVNKSIQQAAYPTQDILKEIKAQGYPVISLTLTDTKVFNDSLDQPDSMCLAIMTLSKKVGTERRSQLKAFLRTRTKSEGLRLFLKEDDAYREN